MSLPISTSFNSSVVRLEGGYRRTMLSNIILFQFQCGAIRSTMLKNLRAMKVRFNSSVVRLEDEHCRRDEENRTSFNSSVVRLEVASSQVDVKARISFNSSVVRLEAENIPMRAENHSVSIPVWCD